MANNGQPMDGLEDLKRMNQLWSRAEQLASSGDLLGGAALAAEGQEIAVAVDDRAGAAAFGVSRGIMLADAGRCSDAQPLLATWLPKLSDSPSLEAAAYMALGSCYARSTDYREAALALVGAARGFERTDQWTPYLRSLVEALEAATLARDDSFDPDRRLWHEANAAAERLVQAEALDRLQRVGPRSKPSLGRFVKRLTSTPAARFNARFDEALATAADGRTVEARMMLSQLIDGISELQPSTPAIRLQLLMLMSSVLGEACVLDGDHSAAFTSTQLAEVIALDNIDQLGGELLAATIKLLSIRTTVHMALGNMADARSLTMRSASVVDRIDIPRQRMDALRAIGIASLPPDDRAFLDQAVALAEQLNDDPLAVDVYFDRAKVEPDPAARLALLDRAISLFPAGLASYADAPIPVEAGATARLAVLEAVRLEALTAVDRGAGAAELDRVRPTATDADPISAMSLMTAACRVGDLEQALLLADAATDGIVNQLDASLGFGQRGAGFGDIEETWTLALETLSRAAVDAPSARRSALRLVEAANRGALNFVHDRGAARAHLVDEAGAPSEMYRQAAMARATPADPTPKILAGLDGRLGVTFVCLEHVPEEHLRGVRLVAGRTEVAAEEAVEVEAFELTGHSLQFLELAPWTSLPSDQVLPAWIELSHQLLGSTLTAALDSGEQISLVVAPGSSVLASVPWAGLHTGRQYVIEAAEVQVTPALSALGGNGVEGPQEEAAGDPVAHALIYGPRLDLGLEDEYEVLSRQSRWTTTRASTDDELSLALRRPGAWKFGHFATHGSGVGRSQELVTESGSRVDVTTAMQYWWPTVTVLAACHVGQMAQAPGQEPLGLPFACLLRGAQHVVGPTVNVESGGTGLLSAAMIGGLAAGQTPVTALASAQRDLLRSRPDVDLNAWAAMQVISLA